MSNPRCDICGSVMKGNGRTKAGAKRWRCKPCGSSKTMRIDNAAKLLRLFLSWLLSKRSIAELGYSRSTFWRKCARFWELWPIAPSTGEVFDTVFLDGIWLSRDAAVLVARSKGHVIAWHLAQRECASSWAALMTRMPAPMLAVSDGSAGLAKAARAVWPSTKIQRCVVHVSCQIKRCTTKNPKLECGRELLGIANRLARAKDEEAMRQWIVDYAQWCADWSEFLKESTVKDGRRVYTHERLRRARGSLNRLVKEGTLFTFIEMQKEHGGEWDSTNNPIESMNAQLREMLRLHRGLPLLHRVKAVMWWCYMHTEEPMSPAEILCRMPRDEDVDGLFAIASNEGRRSDGGPERYGKAIAWNEFHMPTRYRQ
ncbi:IS1249 family transposase [Eggerthellaceae bacterium zg-893]|nr:IS1249 family transposase [Eggerthellaceae bacterium zg-893]